MYPNLICCVPAVALVSVLVDTSNVRAADDNTGGDNFITILPYVVGGIIGILVIGIGVLMHLAKSGVADPTTETQSVESRINAVLPSSGFPIERLAVPALVVVGFGVGIYLCYDAFGTGFHSPGGAYKNVQVQQQSDAPVIPQPQPLQTQVFDAKQYLQAQKNLQPTMSPPRTKATVPQNVLVPEAVIIPR